MIEVVTDSLVLIMQTVNANNGQTNTKQKQEAGEGESS